jgi:transposase
LLAWVLDLGRIGRVGVESTGSYAAGLVRHLTSQGVEVYEINQPHPHTRRRRGKSDSIDAEAAARKTLTAERLAIPKDTSGIVEAIRLLRVAREGAVKARAAACNQLSELIVTALDELREHLTRKTLPGQASLCARLRPDTTRLHEPPQAAKLAPRSVAEPSLELDRDIRRLDQHLSAPRHVVPRTLSLLGVSTGHAGTLLVAAGQNIDRLRSEAAFSHLCAANPIPASSGAPPDTASTVARQPRGQPLPAHDRGRPPPLLPTHARLRTPPHRGRTLEARDHSLPLKHYIAREIYHALRADLAAHVTP